MIHIISATKARNRFFELLNSVMYKGEEYIVEKNGRPAAKIVLPDKQKPSVAEIKKTLAEFRKVFAKSAKRKYWSVIDTPAWKKKEAKYVEDLSKGIIR